MIAHRTLHSSLLALLLTPLACASLAVAQSIAASVKNAADATSFAPQIQGFVDAAITNMKTAGTEKAARQSLIDQTSGTPTPSFLDVYAGVINDALLPLAREKEMHVRLNAAIANAEIARKAGNARQAEATLAFMKDKSEPVALCGVKAAKFEILAQLQMPQVLRKPNLAPAVLATLKAHQGGPDIINGPLVEESYAALTIDAAPNLKGVQPQMLKDVLPDLLAVFEYRISLFGAASPPSPMSENSATLFLTRTKVWDVQSAEQRARTIKDMFDLLGAVQALLAAPNGPSRDELVLLVRQTGRAFQVISDFKSSLSMHKAAEAIAEVTVETKPEEFKARMDAMKTAIDGAGSSSTAGSSSGVDGTNVSGHANPR